MSHYSKIGVEEGLNQAPTTTTPSKTHRGPSEEWPFGDMWLALPVACLHDFHRVGTWLRTERKARGGSEGDEKTFIPQALEEHEETKEFYLEPQSSSALPS